MRTRILSIALGLALPLAVWAADPPGRVGQLAVVQGSAWISPAVGERASAFLNRPLTQGDRIATDAGARIEVQIGSSVLRVAERSELTFTRLDDTHIEVQLAAGSLALRVREPELARELLVRTPDAVLAPQGAGLARVDRFGRGSFAWAVEGQWQVQGTQGSWQLLNAGQRLELWRDGSGSERIEAAALPHAGDAFERWAQGSTDVTYASGDATFQPEVSPEMTGVQDLNRYGAWRSSTDYGSIWFPSQVSAGWSPYSQGQWAWVAPWGWTWVDAMPWGFAPFHYGRWVYVDNQWGWTPGGYAPRPTYAPALVGAASGLFPSNPSQRPTTWRPLAPGQAFTPAYRASSGYTQALNAPALASPVPAMGQPRVLPDPRRLLIGKPGVLEPATQPMAPPPARVVSPPQAPLQPLPGRTVTTTPTMPPAAQPGLAPQPQPPQVQPQPTRPVAPVVQQGGDPRDRVRPTLPIRERAQDDESRDERTHRPRIIR